MSIQARSDEPTKTPHSNFYRGFLLGCAYYENRLAKEVLDALPERSEQVDMIRFCKERDGKPTAK